MTMKEDIFCKTQMQLLHFKGYRIFLAQRIFWGDKYSRKISMNIKESIAGLYF